MRNLLTLLIVLYLAPATAQKEVPFGEMLDWVLTNHPLATAADAVEQRGPAELMAFQGALDPKLAVNYDRKDFKGTEYFDYGEAALEWQSPYAVKIAGGYQRAEGTYLNAERTIPAAGQAYLAIKIPLLQGLLTDATRIGLKRGELAVDRQRALADVVRNEIRYDLSSRYLQWTFANEVLALNRKSKARSPSASKTTGNYWSWATKPPWIRWKLRCTSVPSNSWCARPKSTW